jgi:hypothetical protein
MSRMGKSTETGYQLLETGAKGVWGMLLMDMRFQLEAKWELDNGDIFRTIGID